MLTHVNIQVTVQYMYMHVQGTMCLKKYSQMHVHTVVLTQCSEKVTHGDMQVAV